MTNNTSKKVEIIEEALLESVSGGASLGVATAAWDWCSIDLCRISCIQCIFQDDKAAINDAVLPVQKITAK